MSFSTKRFRQAPPMELLEENLPVGLRSSLNIVATNFNNCRTRNLDIMHTPKDIRLYGLMTYYDSNNFCWIQPTLIRSTEMAVEYDSYIRKVNRRAKNDKLDSIEKIEVGIDCVARYEADNKWYRAVVIEEPQADQWLLFFIDYGNFQRTFSHDMAMPIEESKCSHYHAPLQAVCCRLYNIVPRVPSARIEIDSKLEEFYSKNTDKFLEVKVREVRSDFIVDCDLFLPDDGKTHDAERLYKRHIGQPAVDANLATFADPTAAYYRSNQK